MTSFADEIGVDSVLLTERSLRIALPNCFAVARGDAAPEVTAALALLVLWCLVWSWISLYLIYRTRKLSSVILGHGLSNIFAILNGPFDLMGSDQRAFDQ
ncbi:hypothetical protein KL864_33530 [Mycolicibacterium goodii]|uniref:hypothetical protein n=1 Tax=Mycolicibacterium goodii TaxID=134601 RepID=UPI001BDD7957|nr:hypothetical protein [Mycolicibacterium goodii]MBU8820792.1 hypothetical protein [Mycolicibacterium goodii]